MNLDDVLELLTSVLTLFAIAMVALEKARPDDDGSRKRRLKRFLDDSAFASPRKVQRTAARIVARVLKGDKRAGSVVGFLSAPAMTLLKKKAALQALLLLAVFGLNLWAAFQSGSFWLPLIIPGLVVALVSLAMTYPSFYVMLNSGRLYEALSAGRTFERKGRRWICLDEPISAARAMLTVMSYVHPRVMRHGGSFALRDKFHEADIWPLALGFLCILPIPAAVIDGFAFSGWPYRAFTIFGGLAFLALPIVVVWMVQLTTFQNLFLKQSLAQTAWSGQHILRAAGPTGVIAAAMSFTLVMLNPQLDAKGAGWFVIVILSTDLAMALFTGLRIRSVIRRRADTRSSAAALIWVLFLAVVVSGAKLYIAMLLSEAPLGPAESYRIAWGLELFSSDRLSGPGLFVVAQTATIYWAGYALLLVFMLSLSGFATILKQTFGLAVSTVSPLEILASYLTAVAAVAVLLRSLVKLFMPDADLPVD